MRVQQGTIKDYLLNKGFTFDIEDNISNYSQKLLAYEKHLENVKKNVRIEISIFLSERGMIGMVNYEKRRILS